MHSRIYIHIYKVPVACQGDRQQARLADHDEGHGHVRVADHDDGHEHHPSRVRDATYLIQSFMEQMMHTINNAWRYDLDYTLHVVSH